MENTGRISRTLTPTARRILFGETASASIEAELAHMVQVDRSHLVMLAKCEIIDASCACRLLRAIDELRTCHFAPLLHKSAPRGLYLLYEDYLIERLGERIGGTLQTGRSRNDLNATVLRLRLRQPYRCLLDKGLRLMAVLLRRARRFSGAVMPIYTHYQAAVPISYGHYLAGIATALGRDLGSLWEAGTDINRCPLGAGAVGGTSLPIAPAYTASLLGFDQPAGNSIDAVASRDLILRILASVTILGVTLSRFSTDLLLWTTNEFGFVSLPDQLVGSSSMMPQKRNAFILEHIQGRTTSALGAFVAATTAMHSKPFTNAIGVGTEAVAHIWKALQDMTDAITLTQLVVAAAQPQPEVMLQKAIKGYTSATELANRLGVEGGVPFRSAHHQVGTVIRKAIENGGVPLEEAATRWLLPEAQSVSLAALDPISVAQTSVYGGGPGVTSFNACLEALQADWTAQMRRKQEMTKKWQAAVVALDTAVRSLCQ